MPFIMVSHCLSSPLPLSLPHTHTPHTHMHAHTHSHTHNSYIPQTEQHEPEGRMLFCLGNVTHLLDVTPSNSLPHPLHLHPFHFVLFKFKDLVAKQHPTNTHTHTHTHTHTPHTHTHTHTHHTHTHRTLPLSL